MDKNKQYVSPVASFVGNMIELKVVQFIHVTIIKQITAIHTAAV